MTLTPTIESYGELQQAFDHFNQELFDGQLPQCLFTLQRKRSTYGYYCPQRFANEQGRKSDEIALNPQFFAVVPVMQTLQTIAHEMVHLWQQHYGTPGRRGYHNKEWGRKMEHIGLMPSNTGKPGGRKTGEQMDDYLIAGGRFEQAANDLLAGQFGITWKDRYPDRVTLLETISVAEFINSGDISYEDQVSIESLEALDIPIEEIRLQENTSNRSKYSCSSCGLNAWAKPNIKLICGDCEVPLGEILI